MGGKKWTPIPRTWLVQPSRKYTHKRCESQCLGLPIFSSICSDVHITYCYVYVLSLKMLTYSLYRRTRFDIQPVTNSLNHELCVGLRSSSVACSGAPAGSCIEKKKQCPNPVRQSPLFSGLQLLWLWRLKPTFYAGSSKFFLGMVACSLDSRLSLTCTSLARFVLRPLKKKRP